MHDRTIVAALTILVHCEAQDYRLSEYEHHFSITGAQ